jgi:hypothetical protein
VRFIETSIEKDIRYLATRGKHNFLNELNANQIKTQLHDADRDSISLEKSAIQEAEITISSVDKRKVVVKRQDVMQHVNVTKDRPEDFFESFKADRVKLLKTRILENQQYLKHTVRIIKKDQEKYMQLLGFNKESQKELNAMLEEAEKEQE